MFEINMTIQENTKIARDTYRMRIHCPDERFFEAFRGGQFVQLRVPRAQQLLLRRPFAVETVCRETSSFTLAYQICGQGTALLKDVPAGAAISIVGPLGKPFDVQGGQKEIWLLGGGVGIAPLHSVAQQHPGKKYRSYVGFADKAHVFDLQDLRALGDVILCTDDGSAGYDGYAVAALVEALDRGERPDVVFACGTGQMLAAFGNAMAARNYPVPSFISMESRMGCGTGVCLTCNCKIQQPGGGWEYQRSCVEGPVFPLEEVLFDEIR